MFSSTRPLTTCAQSLESHYCSNIRLQLKCISIEQTKGGKNELAVDCSQSQEQHIHHITYNNIWKTDLNVC